MIIEGNALIILLVVLLISIIFPIFLKKLHLPFVVLLVLAGAILGPNLLGYIENNETILFFGFLGMAFLMLTAGLETNISSLEKSKLKIFVMSSINGLFPFSVGFLIMHFFGYSFTESLLVGIVFISSSVAIIVPILEDLKVFEKDFGQLILSSVLITDITSLVLLGIFFQSVSPLTTLSMWVYIPLLLFSLLVLFFIVPKIYSFAVRKSKGRGDNEENLKIILAIVIGSLIYFSGLGVHPILASFLVGLMLSGIIHKTPRIKEKLDVLGYGLFIPVFFFIAGMDMDLTLITEIGAGNLIMILLILGLILSKFISGFVAGKVVGFSSKESTVFGSISTTQLTTTLAVIYAAVSLGIIDSVIATSIILISIITTFLGPTVVSQIMKKR